MDISYTPVISASDYSPIFALPLRLDYENLKACTLQAQNIDLSQLLTPNLYENFLAAFFNEVAITNIMSGSETIISVSDTSIFSGKEYLRVSNSSGLFPAPTRDQRGEVVRVSSAENAFYKFTILNATDISILYDSTTSTITQLGVLSNVIDSLTLNIFEKVKPFLIFKTLSYFLPASKKKITRSGSVEKNTNESKYLNNQEIANFAQNAQNFAAFWAGELVKFLEGNRSDYPLFEGGIDKKDMRGKVSGLRSQGNALTKKYYI